MASRKDEGEEIAMRNSEPGKERKCVDKTRLKDRRKDEWQGRRKSGTGKKKNG